MSIIASNGGDNKCECQYFKASVIFVADALPTSQSVIPDTLLQSGSRHH